VSRTGEQLLQSLSEFLDDWFSSTATSNGNSGGTTIVDTTLGRYGDGRLSGRWFRLGATPFDARRANNHIQSSGTVTVLPAFDAQVSSADAYSAHRYEPALKFRALDAARLEVMDYAFKIVLDDTLTGDGKSTVFDLPASVEQGPHVAFFEEPQAADVPWNFLTTPELDATTGWTASNLTASTVAYDQADLVIP
jgi:hypothetical protein